MTKHVSPSSILNPDRADVPPTGRLANKDLINRVSR